MLANTWQRRQTLPLGYAFTVKMALVRILMRMVYYTKNGKTTFPADNKNSPEKGCFCFWMLFIKKR